MMHVHHLLGPGLIIYARGEEIRGIDSDTFPFVCEE